MDLLLKQEQIRKEEQLIKESSCFGADDFQWTITSFDPKKSIKKKLDIDKINEDAKTKSIKFDRI